MTHGFIECLADLQLKLKQSSALSSDMAWKQVGFTERHHGVLACITPGPSAQIVYQ